MFNLRSWATPITIGSFVISAISGVILFFHLNIGLMKPAHEWLSWFMILGVAMHVFTNWRAFLQYFKKPIPLAVIGVFLLLTVLSFFSLLWAGFITIELLRLAMFVVPVSIVSAWVGVRIYERLGEAQFKGLILAILAASRISILLSLFW